MPFAPCFCNVSDLKCATLSPNPLEPNYLQSAQILKRLVDSDDFDDDCLVHDGHIREVSPDFEYRFWGTRLAKLNLVVNNPQPLGPIHSWLRRHTNEKNGLAVTIVALVLGAFFSLLSVIIGIVQTWLAWKAWKNPAT